MNFSNTDFNKLLIRFAAFFVDLRKYISKSTFIKTINIRSGILMVFILYSVNGQCQLDVTNTSDFKCTIDGKALIKNPEWTSTNGKPEFLNFAYNDMELAYLTGLTNIGDIDNDGIDDFAIGSWTYGYGDRPGGGGKIHLDDNLLSLANDNGMVFIFFGRKDNTSFWIRDIPIEDKADLILCNNSSSGMGYTITPLGRFNDDPYPDFAVGAGCTNNSTGLVFIFYGKKDRASWNLENNIGNATYSTITGVQSGFFLDGMTKAANTNKYKHSMSTLVSNKVISGRRNISTGDNFGKSLSYADVNNDGYNDLIIGAPGYKDASDNFAKAGKVYIVKGGKQTNDNAHNYFYLEQQEKMRVYSTNFIDLGLGLDGAISSSDPVIYTGLKGSFLFNQVGYSCNGTPDMNGDGIDDVLVGDGGGDYTETRDRKGNAYLIFGSVTFFGKGANLGIANADVTFIGTDFICKDYSGTNQTQHSGLGINLTGIKNFSKNSSGAKLNAIAIGAPRRNGVNNNGECQATGIVYIFLSNHTWSANQTINLNHTTSISSDASIIGYYEEFVESWEGHGFHVEDLGDINNDGFNELGFGADYDRVAANSSSPILKGITIVEGGILNTDLFNLMDTKTIKSGTSAIKDKIITIKGENYVRQSGKPASNGLCFIGNYGDYNGDGVADLMVGDYTVPYNSQVVNNVTYNNINGGKVYLKFSDFTQNLFSRDETSDNGLTEPNPTINDIFHSPDIIVRKQAMNSGVLATISENSEFYTSTNLNNYIYVNIRNKSNNIISANQYKIYLYWTVAATGEIWPKHFDSKRTFVTSATSYDEENRPVAPAWHQAYNCSSIVGKPVGGCINPNDPIIIDANIPVNIDPATDFVQFAYPWKGINPALYCQPNNRTINNTGGLDVCILVRIVPIGINDPYKCLADEKNNVNVGTNVKQKRSLITRNQYCVNENPLNKTGGLLVRNLSSDPQPLNLSFGTFSEHFEDKYTNYGYYVVDLGEKFTDWQVSGANGSGIEVIEGTTKIKILSDSAWIDGVVFNSDESIYLPVEFIDNDVTFPSSGYSLLTISQCSGVEHRLEYAEGSVTIEYTYEHE